MRILKFLEEYNNENKCKQHFKNMIEKEGVYCTTTLKWVHIAISNVKRNLLGIYHKIKGKYLQLYLDEFCYKLNRRYFGNNLFDRLVVATEKSYWYQNG